MQPATTGIFSCLRIVFQVIKLFLSKVLVIVVKKSLKYAIYAIVNKSRIR